MRSIETDPMLPLLSLGHPDVVGARVAVIIERVPLARRNPAAFAALVRSHIEWAMAEATARAGATIAPKLQQDRAAVPRLTEQ